MAPKKSHTTKRKPVAVISGVEYFREEVWLTAEVIERIITKSKKNGSRIGKKQYMEQVLINDSNEE